MKKKNPKYDRVPEAVADALNCPFRDLQIKIVEPSPPPVPVSRQAPDKLRLSREDQELLEAFGGGADLPALPDPDALPRPARGYQLRFTLQRKGKGGKTVTLVHGLKALDIPEQMSICSEIRSALGVGARFLDGLLELQGDQRTRAGKWFADRGFPVQ